MQARVRQYANQLGCRLTNSFAPTYGFPAALIFGSEGSEGTSPAFARADHEHPAPAIPDTDLDTFARAASDLVYSSTTGLVDVDFYASVTTLGGRDTTGETGAYGSMDLTTGAVANAGAAVWLTSSSSGVTTTQEHTVTRLVRFECRAMPCVSTAEKASLKAAFGAIRTSTTRRLDLITDGVYFFLDTDALGDGTYQAVLNAGGSTLVLDTGVSPRSDGGSMLFDTFRIDFDVSRNVFTFYIGYAPDGETVFTKVAELDGTGFGFGRVAGWGCWIMAETAADHKLVADYVLFKGSRVA